MNYNGEDVLKKRLEIRDNIAKSLGVEGECNNLEKAHEVGDIHPNGKLVWTEYQPGKFDWRKNKGVGKKTTAPAAKDPGKKSSNKNRGSKTAGSVPSELKTGDILIDFDIEGRVESVTRVTQAGRSKDGKLKGFNAENKRTKDASNFQGYTINKDGTLSDGADYGEDSMKTMLFHPNTDYRDVINASRKKLGMKPLTNLKPLTEKGLLKELGEDGEDAKERSTASRANVLRTGAEGTKEKKVDSSRLSSKDIEALISEFEEMKVKMSQMQSMIDKIIGE